MTCRNLCFVINNYTEEECIKLHSWYEKLATYCVYAYEVGEKCGTPHIQGYIEFKNSAKFTTIAKYWNKRINMRKRRGTPQEASDYCKKTGTFFEWGTISKQGKRSDLEEIGQEIIDNVPMREIALAHPGTYIRYNRGFHALRSAIANDRTERPHVQWNWGPTGAGKTWEPRHLLKEDGTIRSYYIKDGTIWWDNYDQQEVIIIDDFDGHWPFRDLLRLLDETEYQGQYKGGYVKINSPFIFITCEFPPEHFWQENTLAQVVRRIKVIKHLPKAYKTPKIEAEAEVGGNTSPHFQK